MFGSDFPVWQQIGYCYEILPPHIARDETLPYGPNPPFIPPARVSSLGELMEYHKNNGTLGWFLSTMDATETPFGPKLLKRPVSGLSRFWQLPRKEISL